MTAKELIDKLSGTDPDAEVIGGLWNGRVDTYTVFDHANVLLYDRIYSDLFGTPGAIDDKMMGIRSKMVVYLGSLFESTDKRVLEDRYFIWKLRKILRQHRSRDWKKERIYKLLTVFDVKDFNK